MIPGDQLKLEAVIATSKKGIFKFDCTASVDGELVSTMKIMCAERKVEVD